MEKITTSILETIDMIVEKRLAQAKLDRTIVGSIYKVVNLEKGVYKVKYMDATFVAYALHPSLEQYQENNLVYIKIPENDFANHKIIEGLYQ